MRTLGGPFLALLLQGDGESSPATSAPTIVQLIAESSGVHKAVLLILAIFSVLSWGIVLYKLWVFRRSERQSASFLEVFRRSSKFSEVQAVCKSLGDSPLVGLFQAGYAELSAQLRHSQPVVEAVGAGTSPRAGTSRPVLRSLTAVDRALMRASVVEVNRLEERVAFLATTASITPFIGLFGTVWGIMRSFSDIAGANNTSLAVVAPGIAEALFATALGLFAAIPAVIAYNRMAHGINRMESRLTRFADAFHAALSRELERDA